MGNDNLAAIELVSYKEGKPVTTSLKVAEVFEKNHFHVIRDIEGLGIPDDFNQSNFGLVEIIDKKGEKRKAYEMTKDGFTLLAMGYTGEKAMTFKIAYINAFNKMEAMLSEIPKMNHSIAEELKRLQAREAELIVRMSKDTEELADVKSKIKGILKVHLEQILGQNHELCDPNKIIKSLNLEQNSEFHKWADIYFSDIEHIDNYILKKRAYDSFLKRITKKDAASYTAYKFKRDLTDYCERRFWEFNPIEKCTDKPNRRILRNLGEYFYISTVR